MNNFFSISSTLIVLAIVVISSLGCKRENAQAVSGLKLNEIQIIGSHNSYKEKIEPALLQILKSENPDVEGLDYEHISIRKQLELGLRSLELDVLHDPIGGHYTKPKGIEMLEAQGYQAERYDTTALTSAGLKTFHVPDIDFRSSCLTFKACLSEVKEWSDMHPNHIPVIITINPKSSGVDRPDFTEVLPFDEEALDALDSEIKEIFSSDKLITPRLIKGKYSSLKEAVTQSGWPLLSEMQGRILFVLDSPETITEEYLKANNYDRPMFVNVNYEHPQCAFLIMNSPVEQETAIQERVAQGFMVRTRADANTQEARNGDLSRFEAAIRSGAQVISTDYYLKSLSPNQDFEIVFEDRSYSRCNPVLVTSASCIVQ